MNWLLNKPKKQFLGCIAKHTPPEVFEKCVSEYDDPNAKYEQYKIAPYTGLRNSTYEKELAANNLRRAAVLKMKEGVTISNLPRRICEYVNNHPEEFKDYFDELKAETKYLSTINKMVKKQSSPDAHEQLRAKILRAAENRKEDGDEEM